MNYQKMLAMQQRFHEEIIVPMIHRLYYLNIGMAGWQRTPPDDIQ